MQTKLTKMNKTLLLLACSFLFSACATDPAVEAQREAESEGSDVAALKRIELEPTAADAEVKLYKIMMATKDQRVRCGAATFWFVKVLPQHKENIKQRVSAMQGMEALFLMGMRSFNCIESHYSYGSDGIYSGRVSHSPSNPDRFLHNPELLSSLADWNGYSYTYPLVYRTLINDIAWKYKARFLKGETVGPEVAYGKEYFDAKRWRGFIELLLKSTEFSRSLEEKERRFQDAYQIAGNIPSSVKSAYSVADLQDRMGYTVRTAAKYDVAFAAASGYERTTIPDKFIDQYISWLNKIDKRIVKSDDRDSDICAHLRHAESARHLSTAISSCEKEVSDQRSRHRKLYSLEDLLIYKARYLRYENPDLPVAVKKDQLLLKAREYLKKKDQENAYIYLAALHEQGKQGVFSIPDSIVFYLAKTEHALFKQYDIFKWKAREHIKEYLKNTGTSGRYYKEALSLLGELT